jgi:hypothetical protein
MSERTEVVVELPLARMPSFEESRNLLKQAFAEAKKLIGPGRVLGVVSRGFGVHRLTDQPTLLVRFAVEAPESIQPGRRTSVAT